MKKFSQKSVSVLLCCLMLLLVGCGGGSSEGTSAGLSAFTSTQDSSANPTQNLRDLSITIRLAQPNHVARDGIKAQEITPFSRVEAALVQGENVVSSATANVEPNSDRLEMVLTQVPLGEYTLHVRGFDGGDNLLDEASTSLQVQAGASTRATLVLRAGAAPIARDLTYTTQPGEILTVDAANGVMSNDDSVDGSVTLASGPTQGTLTLNPDGSFVYQASPDALDNDSFVYQLEDPRGTDQATVTITFQVETRGIFVQSGATGNGTGPDDPRPDLLGALEIAQAGDTVFILDSVEELTTPGAAVVPDGVTVEGVPAGQLPRDGSILGQQSRELPIVRVSFRPGNDVVFRNFRSVLANEGANGSFILEGNRNVAFEGMEIFRGTRKFHIRDFTGQLRITDSTLRGGGPGGQDFFGTFDLGDTHILVENCVLDGTSFNLTSQFSNRTSLEIRDSQLSGTLTPTATRNGTFNLMVERTVLSRHSSGQRGRIGMDHSSGGRGDLTLRNSTFEDFAYLRLRSLSAVDGTFGAGGRVLVQGNDGLFHASSGAGGLARFRILGGEYDITVVDNTISDFQGDNFADVRFSVSNDAKVRALVQNNFFFHGVEAILAAGNENTLDLAVLNNQVGKSPQTFGTNQRSLAITANTNTSAPGQITAKIEGNDVGTPDHGGTIQLLTSATRAPLRVENLPELEANNTLARAPSVSAAVSSVPSGTTDAPPYPGP